MTWILIGFICASADCWWVDIPSERFDTRHECLARAAEIKKSTSMYFSAGCRYQS